MPIQETPYEVLSKLFSDQGYSHGAFAVKIENTITIRVYKEGTNFMIKFPEERPVAKVRKLIPLKTKVDGIRLGSTGGVLELSSFPDIPFRYDWVMEDEGMVISAASRRVMDKIPRKFKKENHRKVAEKCLHLCEEWAIISGTDNIQDMSPSYAKDSCKKYVMEHINDDVVGLSFLISIIAGVILRLIVEWIIDNWIVNLKS
jgi:hypothetical protein|tara:strand:+ start:78 stop:683 length:606 start_codon:yes stop_codon:yes gene_type:complete